MPSKLKKRHSTFFLEAVHGCISLSSTNKKMTKIQIPRDQHTGHVLPKPVPAETFCLMEPCKWESWWYTFLSHKGVLKEDFCCVCSVWKPAGTLTRSSMNLVHPEVKRKRLNTSLMELFLCSRGCKATCAQCKAVIPKPQATDRGGLCELCCDKPTKRPRRS